MAITAKAAQLKREGKKSYWIIGWRTGF
jgi:hypothetical protein